MTSEHPTEPSNPDHQAHDAVSNPEPAGEPPATSETAAAEGEAEPRRRRRSRGGRGRNRKSKGAPGADAPAEGSSPELAEASHDDDAGDGDASEAPDASDSADAHAPGTPANPGDRAEGEGGERRRRRRRRGRGRGGRGEPGQAEAGVEGAAPASSGGPSRGEPRHDAHEGDDESDTPRPAKRQRQQLPPSSEQWEEIFEGKSFAELGLRSSVLKGIEAAGFTNPTKIQSEMIPLVLAGKDVLGQSRTGTGKTAAFGLPLFNLAVRDLPFQSLVLAPTRELAIQIASELQELGKFTPIRVSAVYGGQNVGTQARQLDRGPEIIVATPGRLMDMVERRHITLNNVRFAVLDEVDRMLDIGFRDDIKKILGSLRTAHQTVFVSATISPEIEKLARTFMKDAEKLVTTGGSLTVSLVEQYYISVQPWDKRSMLLHVLTHEEPDLTVIFCRMKRTVDELAKYLSAKGIDAHPMHGDMYQGKRNSVMKRLREGTLGVVVASDLAARGLDVDGISHVVNYDLPEDPEVYIHRIGRTARAGRRGVAWSLVTPEQGPLLTSIENLANTHIPEKKYPDFKPGPLPQDIRARIAAEGQRTEVLRSVSRSAPPPLPAKPTAPADKSEVKVTADPSKFPGGIVPTKLPPKMLGGRVKSTRAVKQMIAEAAAPPKVEP